jgi:hypothetical protein
VAADWFTDLLGVLDDDRRAHSMAAGRRASSAVELVSPALRSDVVTAATLHDIGYGHPDLDFHPLDGAHYLAGLGFSEVVCHLVAHHSASTVEAGLRDIPLSAYRRFGVGREDLGQAHRLVWWSDMTTGPAGDQVTVEDRIADIVSRHGADSIVARETMTARSRLLEVGHSPAGSIQIWSG